MGVDYAIVIGVGARFSDAFLKLVPQNVKDSVLDTTNDGNTVIVETLYKDMSLQMHCGSSLPYPVLTPTTLTHYEIVARALDELKLTDTERSVVVHILSLDKTYVETGIFMVHYIW